MFRLVGGALDGKWIFGRRAGAPYLTLENPKRAVRDENLYVYRAVQAQGFWGRRYVDYYQFDYSYKNPAHAANKSTQQETQK